MQDPPPGPNPPQPTPPGGANVPEYQSRTDAPPTKDERNLALLAHLLGLFTSILGPLLIWLLKKEDSPYVDDQGREALNFNLTLLFAYIGVSILAAITCGIGGLLFIPLVLYHLVLAILATVAASKGETYRYPLTVRLVQ